MLSSLCIKHHLLFHPPLFFFFPRSEKSNCVNGFGQKLLGVAGCQGGSRASPARLRPAGKMDEGPCIGGGRGGGGGESASLVIVWGEVVITD